LNDFKNKISMTDGGKVFAFSIFGTAVVSIILAFIMTANAGFLADEKTRQWVSGLVAQLILIGSAVFVGIKNKIDVATAVGAKKSIGLLHVCLLVVLAFATICFMLPIQTAISTFLANMGLNEPQGVSIDTSADLILGLVIVALLPALCEETVYRGFVCNSMARCDKKIDFKAIVISSALFAIMHMNPWQLVHPFVLGGIIAFVYLATKSFWAAAVLHFSNNALVLLLTYLTQGAFDLFIVKNWFWTMPLALVVIIPVIWLFAKNAKVCQTPSQEEFQLRVQERNNSLSWYTAGTVFCLVMFFMTLFG